MTLSAYKIDSLLKPIFNNKQASVLVTMFLVFYGGIAGPELPQPVINLFDNAVFRVFVLSLIVYKGNKNPTLSLVVAIGFVLIMDKLKKEETFIA